MKARTLVELAAISSTIYTISKDKELIEKLSQWAEKGKDKINSFVKEKSFDEDGREMDFLEKLASRMEESRKEMENRISDLVKSSYERMNVAHTDQLTELKVQMTELRKELNVLKTKVSRTAKKGE
ncbi:MAG: hypothetical protein RIT43_1199 [Bacteroidota bacterium]|jgi:polyhydroxyalkanoate synthesis regulator phasin